MRATWTDLLVLIISIKIFSSQSKVRFDIMLIKVKIIQILSLKGLMKATGKPHSDTKAK
jgi:hypothetical protein